MSNDGVQQGRVVIVTGGASGIGDGIVRRFADEGATCVVVDLPGQVEKYAPDFASDRIVVRSADVSDEEQFGAVIAGIAAEFGRVDVLVNNAGIQGPNGSVTDITVDEWDHAQAVLLRSVFIGTKHAARVMKPARRGVIINTASAAGVVAGIGPHTYSSAKAAVIALTKSTAVELSAFGIRVNAVAPGRVITPLTAERIGGDLATAIALEEQRSAFGRAPVPEDLASVVCFLARDEAWYVNGECITVDGGNAVLHHSARNVFYGADSRD